MTPSTKIHVLNTFVGALWTLRTVFLGGVVGWSLRGLLSTQEQVVFASILCAIFFMLADIADAIRGVKRALDLPAEWRPYFFLQRERS